MKNQSAIVALQRMGRGIARCFMAIGLLLLAGVVMGQTMGRPAPGATVLVHVEEAGGTPLQTQAYVTLSATGGEGLSAETRNAGVALFRAVAAGDYEVEVTASGYETARDRVLVMGGFSSANVYIVMKPTGADASSSHAAQVPLLAGKSRKEFNRAVAALREGKFDDAARHLEYPLKHAANDPNVQYVAGVYSLDVKNFAAAREHFEAAIAQFPDHADAQIELGSVLLQQFNEPNEAIPHLGRALALDPSAWRAHWLIAQAYLLGNGDFARAEFHSTQALELGKEKAAGASVTLACALAFAGHREDARAVLEKFVREEPNDPAVSRAKELLGSSLMTATAAKPTSAAGAVRETVEALSPVNPTAPEAPALLPKNVDAEIPPVSEGAECSLPDVLAGAAQREAEFIVALEKFTAREEVSQDELDGVGVTRKSFSSSFNYVAILERPRSDRIVVREVRRGYDAATNPFGMALGEGLPAIGLILASQYAGDFNFTCEGLSQWNGQPAWQLHFEQRADREPRIQSWQVNGESYPMALKGRAWISTGSFRLLRIETDLVRPVPKIKLDFEHMAIEYAPVDFTSRKEELWLPFSAEVYSRVRGRIYREDHRFTDFMLFSVDTAEQNSPPIHQ
jgi:tetratricopeptide (TPR) repeat protein